jgi:hypothetical protein
MRGNPRARTRRSTVLTIRDASEARRFADCMRLVHVAEHKAAKRAREQAARAAELAARAQRVEATLAAQSAERAILLEAEQKAAADARYPSRKAAKKAAPSR